MKQWWTANGGPLALVVVGIALTGFKTPYGWVVVVLGLLALVGVAAYPRLPWKLQRTQAGISCVAEIEATHRASQLNGRWFENIHNAWLYVTNDGPTAEFSARFTNVEGVPETWGSHYGVRHVLWEGGTITTRPTIDGHGGERRCHVAQVALLPRGFWFMTIENGRVECGNQYLISQMLPERETVTISFDIKIVNHGTQQTLTKRGTIVIPADESPTFSVVDKR
jgi:hypothetical protein